MSRRLAEITRLPLYPIDVMQYRRGGGKVPDEEYLQAHAEGTHPKPSMIQRSRARRSVCAVRYSSSGTLSPPRLYCMISTGYSGSRVISASLRDNVDLPPPAFPNTATFFIVSTAIVSKSEHSSANASHIEESADDCARQVAHARIMPDSTSADCGPAPENV